MSLDYEVLGVRQLDSADEKTVAVVSFAFVPSAFQPLRITRNYKPQGSDEYKTSNELEIEGARMIRVRSSFLKLSKNNEYYINVPSGLDLPWELSKAIAQTALRMLSQKQDRDAG